MTHYPLTWLVAGTIGLAFLFLPQIKNLYILPIPYHMETDSELIRAMVYWFLVITLPFLYTGFIIALAPPVTQRPRALRPLPHGKYMVSRERLHPFFQRFIGLIEGLQNIFGHPLRTVKRLQDGAAKRNFARPLGSLIVIVAALFLFIPLMMDSSTYSISEHGVRFKFAVNVCLIGVVFITTGMFRSDSRSAFWINTASRALVFLIITNVIGELLWLLPNILPNWVSYRPYTLWAIIHLAFLVIAVARVSDIVTRGFPLKVAVAGIIIVVLFGIQYSSVHIGEPGNFDKGQVTRTWFSALRSRLDSIPKDDPVIFVAASGGGARAALFTTLALDYMKRMPSRPESVEDDTSTSRSVFDNVVLLSGVSGGSLALAHDRMRQECEEGQVQRPRNYLVGEVRHEIVSQLKEVLEKKRPIIRALPLSDQELLELLSQFETIVDGKLVWPFSSPVVDEISADFTAPLLRGLLLPWLERGESVARFWQEKLNWLLEGVEPSGLGHLPLLVLNASDVGGAKFMIGIPSLPFVTYSVGVEGQALTASQHNLRIAVSEAVRASANFPWVFTEPRLRTNEQVTLIDGGVLDNSGIDALDLIFSSLNGLAFGNAAAFDPDSQRATESILTELRQRDVILIEIDSGNHARQASGLSKTFPNYFNPAVALLEADRLKMRIKKSYHIERIERVLEKELNKVPLICDSNVMTAWTLGAKDKATVIERFMRQAVPMLEKKVSDYGVERRKEKRNLGELADAESQIGEKVSVYKQNFMTDRTNIAEREKIETLEYAEQMRMVEHYEARGEYLSDLEDKFGPVTGGSGWVFLGTFEERMWKTNYFNVRSDMYPELIATGMQFEAIGHSNVRSGKPDPNGEFQSIVDVIRQGTIVTIQKVEKWEQTGFIWAEVTY